MIGAAWASEIVPAPSATATAVHDQCHGVVRVDSVVVTRRKRTILDVDRLVVDPGELVAVCGPNGAGKSTLLGVLAGTTQPDTGRVSLAGCTLLELGEKELARRRSVLAQQVTLPFPFLVHEVVALGRAPFRGALSPNQDAQAVADSIGAMALEPLADRDVTTLSGGECQRVHIARCLAQTWRPVYDEQTLPWLLLDEPTAALDLYHRVALMRLLQGLARDGCGIVAVLHDIGLVRRWAQRCIVMKAGRVVSDRRSPDLLPDSLIESVFDVDRRDLGLVSP